MSDPVSLELYDLKVGRDGKAATGPLAGRLPGPGLNLLLGRAGSGKTTLLMTLAGFLPVVAGRVVVGPPDPFPVDGPTRGQPEGSASSLTSSLDGRRSLDGSPTDRAEAERPPPHPSPNPTLSPSDEGSKPGSGRPSAPWEPEGKVCLAFQNPETLFFLPTVGEEIRYALLERGATPAAATAAGEIWLDRWGLPPAKFWNRHPLSLSGGEKRRVALAACTVFRPSVVLLDEPLAGLDREGQETLLTVLQGLAAESLVLVVTHDPEPFLPASRSVLLLDGGAGRWFPDSQAFLRTALAEPGVFPLPAWYRGAMDGRVEVAPLPWPEAGNVSRFLQCHPTSTTCTK